MYGVVVGPEPVEYAVEYTDSDGRQRRVGGEPGKGWAAQVEIPHTQGGAVRLGVLVSTPFKMPDYTVRWPQVQCRIDIDGVMAGSSDKVDTDSCDVIVKFSDLKTRPTATPQGPKFEP